MSKELKKTNKILKETLTNYSTLKLSFNSKMMFYVRS